MQVKSFQFAVIFGALSVLAGQEVWAEQAPVAPLPEPKARPAETFKGDIAGSDSTAISSLSDLPPSATTVKAWMAQIEAATVQVTSVKLNPTDTGLEIVLETQDAKPLPVDAAKFRSEGSSLIADIPNAVLALPKAQVFTAENPTADIATVQVMQQADSSIRISVTGQTALPKTEVTLKTGAFAYSLNPEVEEPEEEIVVTGQSEGSYFVPDTSLATKTDTPIRDIPASIQIVPQEVLRDRNVRNLSQSVETVSGVLEGGDRTVRIIRGFSQDGNFRNGNRDVGAYGVTATGTIEKIEVLKGPGSVLFGQVEPGGIINVVTKQPLSNPYFNLGFEAGNYGAINPNIDISGSLNANKTVLGRFIASYRTSNPIPEPTKINETTVAPSITLKLGERTNLNLYYEYSNITGDPFWYYSGIFSDGSLFPRNFFNSYPNLAKTSRTTQKYGYEFKHQFSDNLQIRNNFSVVASNNKETNIFGNTVEGDRIVTGITGYFDLPNNIRSYFGNIDLLGKFNTGSVEHQVLLGFDFNPQKENYTLSSASLPDLDIFNPNYNVDRPEEIILSPETEVTRQSYGLYLQDQIALTNNLKLLIGGRYDWVSSKTETLGDGDTPNELAQTDGAFSPRVGLVYQPNETVSLYTSFSQSFRQSTGFNPDGRAFKPTRGTQYEIGVKTDFFDQKLSATLAAYQITKSNVTTPDPNNPLFSIQTGKQESRGIELDVVGEILPGWNIIASYAYTDAKVAADNSTPVGNRLQNVPFNQASLWTTYSIKEGDVKGLGFGLGFFVIAQLGCLDNVRKMAKVSS